MVRSTEPFLDVYFDWAPALPEVLVSEGFELVSIGAATGRHFAVVATKGVDASGLGASALETGAVRQRRRRGVVVDSRPSAEERLRDDQHVDTAITDVTKVSRA